MTTFTHDTIGDADEIQLATQHADGTLSPYVTIWIVRAGDGLYVRSAIGPDGSWFRRVTATGTGRVRAAGIEWAVRFTKPMPGLDAQLSDTYRRKYRRQGARFVDMMVAEPAVAATVQIMDRENEA